MPEQTKREIQSEETKERIILAATHLFARKGYYATSISDISTAVELTKGALYHHFKNKEAIFFAIVERIRTAWGNKVTRKVLGEKGAEARLTMLVDCHARLIEENESFCLVMNALMIEMEGVNPLFFSTLQGVFLELTTFIERILKEGQSQGQIRSDIDARLSALTVVGMLRAMGCSRPIFVAMDVSPSDMEEAMKKMLLKGLLP